MSTAAATDFVRRRAVIFSLPERRGRLEGTAEVVWTAIAPHTTPGIPGRTGPEAAARSYGVGRALFFVVEPDRARLADLVRRVRDGRLEVRVGAVRPLPEAAAAFAPEERVSGRTIIRVAED